MTASNCLDAAETINQGVNENGAGKAYKDVQLLQENQALKLEVEQLKRGLRRNSLHAPIPEQPKRPSRGTLELEENFDKLLRRNGELEEQILVLRKEKIQLSTKARLSDDSQEVTDMKANLVPEDVKELENNPRLKDIFADRQKLADEEIRQVKEHAEQSRKWLQTRLDTSHRRLEIANEAVTQLTAQVDQMEEEKNQQHEEYDQLQQSYEEVKELYNGELQAKESLREELNQLSEQLGINSRRSSRRASLASELSPLGMEGIGNLNVGSLDRKDVEDDDGELALRQLGARRPSISLVSSAAPAPVILQQLDCMEQSLEGFCHRRHEEGDFDSSEAKAILGNVQELKQQAIDLLHRVAEVQKNAMRVTGEDFKASGASAALTGRSHPGKQIQELRGEAAKLREQLKVTRAMANAGDGTAVAKTAAPPRNFSAQELLTKISKLRSELAQRAELASRNGSSKRISNRRPLSDVIDTEKTFSQGACATKEAATLPGTGTVNDVAFPFTDDKVTKENNPSLKTIIEGEVAG